MPNLDANPNIEILNIEDDVGTKVNTLIKTDFSALVRWQLLKFTMPCRGLLGRHISLPLPHFSFNIPSSDAASCWHTPQSSECGTDGTVEEVCGQLWDDLLLRVPETSF